MEFSEFKFTSELMEGLQAMGFQKATPIQAQAIPIIQSGKDLIGCAQTGTGKTGAFLLPVLDKIHHQSDASVKVLILVPTRELAIQIDQQIEGFAYFLSVSSLPIYGGGNAASYDQQKKAMVRGADVIIATPGRLISHLNFGYANLKTVQYLILDEADRMLDMGFYDDLIKIINSLPEKRQNLLFSATMPKEIRKLANTILSDPLEINIALSKPAAGVMQGAYLVYDTQKNELIHRLINGKKNYKSILVFTSTKKKVNEIVRGLRKNKYDAAGISSDLDQGERERVLQKFKGKSVQILVATDILSRGIDIKDINLVINYDVPQDAEDYVHRVGRTARADTTGVALTFINDRDVGKFQRIEKLIGSEVKKMAMPEGLGSGPPYKVSRGGGGNRGGYRGKQGNNKGKSGNYKGKSSNYRGNKKRN